MVARVTAPFNLAITTWYVANSIAGICFYMVNDCQNIQQYRDQHNVR